MFSGFPEATNRFFMELRFHNDPSFFHAEHERYLRDVQAPFYALIEDLAPVMQVIDPSIEVRPHKCLARIHRDTRFSKDKSPYRDHLWLLFRKAGEPRDHSLFYWFEYGLDHLGWGLGFWFGNRPAMDMLRRKIIADPRGMSSILADPALDERGIVMSGDFFKRLQVPEQVPPELLQWYLAKDFYLSKTPKDRTIVFDERLVQTLREDFQTMAPVYRLFRGITDEAAE